MNYYHDFPSSTMRHRVTIKRLATSAQRDELGQYPVVEDTVATVWASVVPQTGSLLSGRVADVQISRTTHKVVIRYRPGITPDMWVEVAGERYDILYILDPYLRHQTLELFCEVRYGS